jgi:PAS domain-containing protein
MVAELLNARSTWTGELVARRKNGGEFFVQVSATRNRNADGELVGIVFSFVDSSDRKRAEEAMREAERNRVVLESLGAACHHLGQPATILQANLELLNGMLAGADGSVQDLIKSSMENMERLGEILHKLHAVNQYQTSEYLGMGGPGQADVCRIIKI